MMKKLFVICSWALLLGGCKSESGASDPDGDKPVPPPSAELLQKIEDLNAGLVSLKTLAGAVSQSEVRSLAETEDGVRLTFCDGTEVTVQSYQMHRCFLFSLHSGDAVSLLRNFSPQQIGRAHV